MGPDGANEHDKPQVSRVEIQGLGVRVGIGTPEGFSLSPDFLFVRFEDRGYRGRRSDLRFYIHGGNTNDGDVARYEQAIEAYRDAVKVAKRIQRVLDDPTMFDGFEEMPEAWRGVVASFPDYVLGAWLVVKGDSVVYNRAHPEEPEVPTDWNGWPVLGLEGLRARVHDLAFGKVAQDA